MSNIPQITKEEYNKCYNECLTTMRKHIKDNLEEYFLEHYNNANYWLAYHWNQYNTNYCPSFDEPSGCDKRFHLNQCKKYACLSKALEDVYNDVVNEIVDKKEGKNNINKDDKNECNKDNNKITNENTNSLLNKSTHNLI